jgi:hypothetical protein
MRTRRVIALIVLLLAFASACGAEPPATAGYTIVTAATLTPTDHVSQPIGPIVLSLTGKIGTTNSSGRLDFDMETLEKLGLVEFTVDDPYLKHATTYQGILLQHLLDIARVPQDATTLHAVALNDYATDVPIKPTTQWPVMLATKRDGQRMLVSDKGPLEIVFPYNSFSIDPTVYDPMWVWQLRSFEVR